MTRDWYQVFFARNETGDKRGDYLGKQLCLPLVGVDDGVGEAHFLQLHKAAQRGKDMVQYGDFAAHLKPLDVADLFEQAVILFNSPVLVVQLLKVQAPEGAVALGIRQASHVMAQLVLQARAKQLDRPEIAQSHHPAFCGNIKPLHVYPRAFFH
jgi:hypothetical protein